MAKIADATGAVDNRHPHLGPDLRGARPGAAPDRAAFDPVPHRFLVVGPLPQTRDALANPPQRVLAVDGVDVVGNDIGAADVFGVVFHVPATDFAAPVVLIVGDPLSQVEEHRPGGIHRHKLAILLDNHRRENAGSLAAPRFRLVRCRVHPPYSSPGPCGCSDSSWPTASGSPGPASPLRREPRVALQ